ncbi:hypothetical protein Peur_007432 [Populus x canadensis]
MAAAAEITSGNNINAATDSVRPGQHHRNIEVVVAPQQPLPTGDGAEGIYESFRGEVNARITKRGETALHIAAAAEHTHFVKQLVGKMSIEALTYKNEAGNTAFCFAAISGVEALAKVMMETGRDLAMTRDVALRILKAHPGLAYACDEHQLTALHALAQKSCMPSNVVDQSPPGFWNKCLDPFSGLKLAQMKKLMHKQTLDLIQYLWEQVVLLDDSTISCQIGKPWPLIFTAAERGNLDLLTILIRLYPELIFKVDQNTYRIFHIAILNRHEDILKMIYQIGSIKNVMTIYKDREGNNMLHLAAKVLESPSRLNVIPGAALQRYCNANCCGSR